MRECPFFCCLPQKKYGYIVDNPNVGPTLTKSYWECGNSKHFLDLVKELTGRELTGEAWVNALKEPTSDRIVREKQEYDAMIEKTKGKTFATVDKDIDLKMKVNFVDGDEVISSSTDGGLLAACKKFEEFVGARVAAASGGRNGNITSSK